METEQRTPIAAASPSNAGSAAKGGLCSRPRIRVVLNSPGAGQSPLHPKAGGRVPCAPPALQPSKRRRGCAGWSGTSKVVSGLGSPSPLPPQTSVQMLTGVAGLGFRYERQRFRVELLGKRHQESQSLIGVPPRDESPWLPGLAKAKRGHWSRAVKATHRRHRGRSPPPEGASSSGLGCCAPSAASPRPASPVQRRRCRGASLRASPGSLRSPPTAGLRGGRLPKASPGTHLAVRASRWGGFSIRTWEICNKAPSQPGELGTRQQTLPAPSAGSPAPGRRAGWESRCCQAEPSGLQGGTGCKGCPGVRPALPHPRPCLPRGLDPSANWGG